MVESDASALEARIQARGAALSETLGTLAEDVTGEVRDSLARVRHSVQHVRDVARATVDGVRHGLDLPGHVERHPFGSVLAATGVGFLLARAAARRRALAAGPAVLVAPRPYGVGALLRTLAWAALETAVTSYAAAAVRRLRPEDEGDELRDS
jgi:hypothetical protein